MLHRKSRRTFLKGLLGTFAASGVSVTAKAKVNDVQGAMAAQTPEKRGYHETEHIRDYYNKVNF